MASTYSDLKFELIGTGEQSGTWGNTTNTNLGTAIEQAITGSADVTFASGTVTLTLTDTNASQTARNLRLNLTGTSGGAQNLIVPAIEKFYLVNNGCADAITVKNSSGTGIAVPAGKAMLVFNNGTNVVDAVTHMSSLTLTTALAIAQGGTGATTADTALDNLGGTTVGKGVFKAATAAAAQQAMDTEVGVDVQAYDADLTALGGLAKTDGNFIVGDGSTWVAESGATARTSLGLGSIATQASSAVTITGGSITGITDLAVADGGTGQGSYTDGQLLIGNTTGNTLTKATITAGSGITVTNGSGAITIAASGGGGFTNMDVITATGTWTIPAGVTTVKVTVVGGGGNSGSATGAANYQPSASGGGGSAGTAIKYLTGLTPGNTFTVTRGAVAGTSSLASGTESITTITATGGTTSANTSIEQYLQVGGNGGTATNGTLNIPGQAGEYSFGVGFALGCDSYAWAHGGKGGSTLVGLGGMGSSSGLTLGTNKVVGKAAVGYGAGGGGSSSCANTAAAGAAGTAGVIIFEY
jgi:hypothetical protein